MKPNGLWFCEMTDSETATLLGGGEENWTEDKSFYIGRIDEVQLYDGIFPVYTCCDDDKKVNAVSVWLDRIVSLMWTGQLLSLYMNLAIGELPIR